MCDGGWTEQSRFLVFVHGQASDSEWEVRRKTQPLVDRRKLILPAEVLPEVAAHRCSRMWNGDVLFPVEPVVAHMPNAVPYETKRPPAQFAQIRAMLGWGIRWGLKVQVLNGMTCHPGNGFNEYFTTVPLDLTPEQLVQFVAMEEAPLRAELERLVTGRPTILHNPMTSAA